MKCLNFGFPLFFLFCLSAYGQSFVNEQNTWIISESWWNGQGGSWESRTDYYKFEGTTLINGLTYHKQVKSEQDYNYVSTGSFYREDDNGAIYQSTVVGEVLVMDQSFEVGDTLIDFNNSHAILSIDSLMMIDGSFRKRFGLESLCGADPFYWIEGMGFPSAVFFSTDCFSDAGSRLDCYYHNNDLMYTSGACDDELSALDETEEVRPTIYPNPTSDRIQLSGATGLNFKLFDLKGILLDQGPISNNGIDLTPYANGLFFLEFRAGERSLGRDRIIKH